MTDKSATRYVLTLLTRALRFLDTEEVTGSNPVSPTHKRSPRPLTLGASCVTRASRLQTDRQHCPVCAHSVRVVDGRLVEHADPRWGRSGDCPGSGDDESAPRPAEAE